MFHEIDGISFETRDEIDLSWLSSYGRVFHVFDRQDSGNLCFGVDGPYGKLFIKCAGARTMNYIGRCGDAVVKLRNAIPIYQATKHPALIHFLASGNIWDGAGYAAVFRWQDGQCLHPTPPDPQVLSRLAHLPLIPRLKMLDDIIDLHVALSAAGYVAVDFYDGNVLIDFPAGRAYVCDVDLYLHKPAVNTRGRMQGSSRFMSPEEFTKGAVLDECTTVYNMGCLAFEFFGDMENKDLQSWDAPKALYDVAAKAVCQEREERYINLRKFQNAWRKAVCNSWIR